MRRLVVLVAACASRGGAGDALATLPGTHVAFPCVELAVAPVRDAVALQYAFGNRCDHRVMVDFTALHVVAHDAYGRDVDLVPHDPRHEMRALPLPGGYFGGERIEYDAPNGEQIAISQVCVDASRFAPGEEGRRWTCLEAAASVVSRKQRRPFGWWSSTTAMSWDAGASWLRFVPTSDDRPVTAAGLRLRALIGFPYQLYLVAQVDLAKLYGSPSSTGNVTQDSLALGWRTPLGPLTAGGELAPSFRLAALTVQGVQLPAAWELVPLARVKIDAWLSPSWSLGFAASSNVLRTGDYSLAVTLGLHAVPYDALH